MYKKKGFLPIKTKSQMTKPTTLSTESLLRHSPAVSNAVPAIHLPLNATAASNTPDASLSLLSAAPLRFC